MDRYKKVVLPICSFVGFLIIWEVAVRIFQIDLFILPAPSDILSAMMQNWDVLWMHSMVTLEESLIGLGISTILAIIIAILMDVFKGFRYSIFPHLIISQTIPVMVLGPLLSIWLGFGMAPKIIMVILMCFFPIVVAFSDALSAVNEKQVNLLKSFGASKIQIYRYVKIPAALASLISGLKVAATYCIGGAIVGEWLSASAGLGYYMIRVKNGYMLDKVFACVVMVILWSLLLHVCVSFIEYRFFSYKHKRKGVGK